jgi:hypothetical protein
VQRTQLTADAALCRAAKPNLVAIAIDLRKSEGSLGARLVLARLAVLRVRAILTY